MTGNEKQKTDHVSFLIEEMRKKGNLPVIDNNVRDICNLTGNTNTCAADLSAIIMRDCGLTTNILSTANSTLYSPRYPIKTITNAVTFLGFEKVRAMALGMSLFKQTMKSGQGKHMLTLYASAYFSGTFSMHLANEAQLLNPEEYFVAGLLYRLPWIALANTFPAQFKDMDDLVHKENMSYDAACLQVFDVSYTDICKRVCEIYNLPNRLKSIVSNTSSSSDPAARLVNNACQISNMLFAEKLGGEEALGLLNGQVAENLKQKNFSVTDFIRKVCIDDQNISRYFRLDNSDVNMMINALEWGKGNPIQITGNFAFDTENDLFSGGGDPEQMIGHFLTELMVGARTGGDINEFLMLAQEAIYRCLSPAEVFTAFFNPRRDTISGKFFVGRDSLIKAADFQISALNKSSIIVQAVIGKTLKKWSIQDRESLSLPKPCKKLNIQAAAFIPILCFNQPIGLYFVCRPIDKPFSPKEEIWLEQIADSIGRIFEQSRKR